MLFKINPMIAYLKGILAFKGETPGGNSFLILEVNGIGYQIYTSTRSYSNMPELQSPLTIHTSLIVREDSMQLVGFTTYEERELFSILETASGVGFKVALSLLSEFSVSDLVLAIENDQHKILTTAKGVGPKLAQKITIELKDKISKWHQQSRQSGLMGHLNIDSEHQSVRPAFQEAETVLLSLGYTSGEIYKALQSLKSNTDNPDNLSSEEVLQWVLKWLATNPIH